MPPLPFICSLLARPGGINGPQNFDIGQLTIVRLVGGTGLDALHLFGLDDMVGQAQEEEYGRRHEGSGAAASPLGDHHGFRRLCGSVCFEGRGVH